MIPYKPFFSKKNLVPPKKAGLGLIRVDWRLSNIYIYKDFISHTPYVVFYLFMMFFSNISNFSLLYCENPTLLLDQTFIFLCSILNNLILNNTLLFNEILLLNLILPSNEYHVQPTRISLIENVRFSQLDKLNFKLHLN